MGRRLLSVGKKVSGALVGALGEPDDTPDLSVAAAEPSDDATAPEPVAAGSPPGDAVPVGPAPTAASDAPVEPDPEAASAVELARAAAVAEGGDRVGEHLGATAEPAGEGHVVTHSFATRDPAYVGWQWAVTVARADGSASVTVDEVVLLPGSGALLAPAWVPWSDRIAPGDLSPGDLLPPPADDPRLVPAYADVDAPRLPFDLDRELGLGRPRVLSLEGRAEAAERWYDGDAGPRSALAKAAPATCSSCGFLTPLAGALGTVFGACANGYAADDGRVVALTHGCGAHSETVVAAVDTGAGMAVQHEELEIVPNEPDSG